jgi:hypothetical protein
VWPLIMRYAPGALAQTKRECVVLGLMSPSAHWCSGSITIVAGWAQTSLYR